MINHKRHTISIFLFLTLLLVLFSSFGHGAIRLGLFPVQPSYSIESKLATYTFMNSLTETIVQDLEEANVGQIILLPWPKATSDENRPNFETLIAKGIEAGCNGILVMKLEALKFSVTEKKLPAVGWIKLANADVWLKGGLLDVQTGAAVSPVDARGKDSSKYYKGPNPGDVQDEPINSQYFEKSLLGKAVSQLRQNLMKSVKNGLGRLTPGQVKMPVRESAPEGVGFARDSYTLEVPPGFDRRGIISVVNRGQTPENFIIKPLESPRDVMIGLKGQGSIDSPCLLGPEEWKYVRLIVNSDKHHPPQTVKLGLFTAAGENEPDLNGEPWDTASIHLKFQPTPAQVKLSILSQDPVTLAYSCSLINQGETIDNLRLEPLASQEEFVRLFPDLKDARIPAGGSLNFKVIPNMIPGIKSMDVTLEGNIGASQQSWKFHFEVPEGKRIYYGLGHSIKIISSNKSDCTNRGFIITGIKDYHNKKYYTCEGDDDPLAPDTDIAPFKRFRGYIYSWISRIVGNPSEFNNTAGNAADVRGATIRENLRAWLPDLDKDSRTHPMVSAGDKWIGLVNYAPGKDGISVHFVAFGQDGNGYRSPLRLNEKGHVARWPYLRAQYNGSRAFVIWEDSVRGRTDVAFRASGEWMNNWGPVLYLTRHGEGVSDPVVKIAGDGILVTAWQDLRSGRGRIYLRLSRNGGRTFEPEITIPKAEGEIQSWPQVAPTADGEYALIYSSWKGENTNIVMRMLDGSGAPQGTFRVLSQSHASCGEPQITCSPKNHLYAVWREGEGQQSEILFVKSMDKGMTWTPPKQLTNDEAYSEYPLVGADESTLWVSYHSNISGAADLKYVIASQDDGETWGESVTMPSIGGKVLNAWLEVNFSLKWPRSNYLPHNTYISFNGVKVGAIENNIPEGTFVFKVPAELVVCSPTEIGFNQVKVAVEGLNHADYIMMTDIRLVVEQSFSQVPIVAVSQAEADRLAGISETDLNHSKPDIVLAANRIQHLPDRLVSGQKVNLNLQVYNLGEVSATKVKVVAYKADPRDPTLKKEKIKLAEQNAADIAPGAYQDINLSFRSGLKVLPRIYVAVQCQEKDFYYDNNVWRLSFTEGDGGTLTPLLGTDIPNVFYAPELMDFVNIPDVPALEDLVTLPDFPNLVSLPGWGPPNISNIGRSLLTHLERLGIKKPHWLK